MTASISGGGLDFWPRNPASNKAPWGGEASPGRGPDDPHLRDQRSSRRRISRPDGKDDHRVQLDHRLGQQARLAAGLELEVLNRVPALVVPTAPTVAGGPPQSLLGGDLVSGETRVARLSRGAVVARPSVTRTASPSRSRSDGRGAPAGGGADRAARGTSGRLPTPANRPANIAATHASR
jgi:hypothetical protein